MSWEDEDFDVDLDDRRRFKQAGFSDEEDDDGLVKDAWDADSGDEAKKATDAAAKGPAQPAKTKKKTIKQIAAEKEAKARAEAEARRRVHDAARGDGEGEDGPVDDAAEKLRRQKLVEEADMDNARDLFGADDKGKKPAPAQGIDAMNPASRAEFDAFAKAMTDKLLQFDTAPLYAHCLETIFKDAVANMHFEDVRKLSAALNVIANQKQTAEKTKKGAGAKKKKGATIAKMGKDDGQDAIETYGSGRHDDTYDDFI